MGRGYNVRLNNSWLIYSNSLFFSFYYCFIIVYYCCLIITIISLYHKKHKVFKRVTCIQCSWTFIFCEYHIIWKPLLRPQKSNRLNNNFARFFVHFFAISAWLQHKSALLWRVKTQYSDFLFLFVNFDTVFRRIEWDGISAITKTQKGN